MAEHLNQVVARIWPRLTRGLAVTEDAEGIQHPSESRWFRRALGWPDNESALHEHLDAVIQRGARKMLAAALEAEVAEYVDRHAKERDADGHRLVVRNGKAKPRAITTSACPSG